MATPIPTAAMDLTGWRFGLLTVRREINRTHNGATYECVCRCGTVVEHYGSALRSGRTKSCGCLYRATRRKAAAAAHASMREQGRPWCGAFPPRGVR